MNDGLAYIEVLMFVLQEDVIGAPILYWNMSILSMSQKLTPRKIEYM